MASQKELSAQEAKEIWGSRTKLIEDGNQAEGFETIIADGKLAIKGLGKLWPYVHPFAIYAKLYRTDPDPDMRYQYFQQMDRIVWPRLQATSNYWHDGRMREHCSTSRYITLAGCASSAKSHSAARIALLYWWALPRERTVLVSSTTLASLDGRVWGYVKQLFGDAAIPLEGEIRTSKPAKIIIPAEKNEFGKRNEDSIHGIFAVAAKTGSKEKSIGDLIGRHPKDGILIMLDECTDQPLNLIEAFPNLDTAPWFQVWGIGNSNSWHDLHGILSTPKKGIKSIDPKRDTKWETTQTRGVCLYYSGYNSPAIVEADPAKKARLSKFFPTIEKINEKKLKLGADSEGFHRFVLGFWRTVGTAEVVISNEHLERYNPGRRPEWSGHFPLKSIYGIDMAFTASGDSCLMRKVTIGHTVSGLWVADMGGRDAIRRLHIRPGMGSPEIQICHQIARILMDEGLNLDSVVLDCSGGGRVFPELLRVETGLGGQPLKVISTGKDHGLKEAPGDTSFMTISALQLWLLYRTYIQEGQIFGLDNETVTQLTSRRILRKPSGAQLEPKEDFVKRLNQIKAEATTSPDEADAGALALLGASVRLQFYAARMSASPSSSDAIFLSAVSDPAIQAALRPSSGQSRQVVSAPQASFGAAVEEAINAAPWLESVRAQRP
jgi:hypothetical protein